MNNRATGMAFLAMFTVLLIAAEFADERTEQAGLLAFFAFLFLIVGVVYLIRRDPPPHP